ncbi:hypothetical protein AD998_05915 [bacterium 336/3]|nr:hypothetical protein AD998_05915 [bacterium 336/3]
MAQRIKIGLIFSNNEAWIGGTYYILNLIQALRTLPEEKLPHLVIFCDKESDVKIIKNLQYPYTSFEKLSFQYNIFEKIVNKLSRLVFDKNIITKCHPKHTVNIVFPFDFQESLGNISYRIAWIPDFQEYFLGHFFSKEELEKRKKHHLRIIKYNLPIIFSSKVAQAHFNTIYSKAKNQTFILNFAVSHPEYININSGALLEKFDITKPYFIAPNQFWIHKNHQVILNSILHMKENQKILPFQIVFTGKEYDFRYPEYTQNLKKFVQNNGLVEDVLFLGFIDRLEQLKLMKNALAVVQPSLFEGWSTVVEDAKAMKQILILSDIEVHREQARNNKYLFFPPQNALQLSKCIEDFLNNHVTVNISDNYQKNIEDFGLTFINILNSVLNNENPLS